MERLQQRLSREDGFTLIELLVVIVIIGILLAIAVPSYLGFKDTANKRAASADVRAAVPSAEAYYAEPSAIGGNGSYTGMTLARLQAFDTNIKITADPVIGSLGKSYCMQYTVAGFTSTVQRGAVPANNGDVLQGGTCPGTITDP